MSPDQFTAGSYNQNIDKRLAHNWSDYMRLGYFVVIFVGLCDSHDPGTPR